MSIIIYNGVKLPYGNTTQFNQDAVYEDSNTDWILVKFDITQQFLINTNFAPNMVSEFSTPQNATPTDIMDAIRSRLMKPRKKLSFTFNGVEMVPNFDPTEQQGTVDAANGPKPQNFTYIQLTNETFLCTYHIIAQYWEKNTINKNANPKVQNSIAGTNNILYNRWSEIVDLDKEDFSRRTRRGKFIIRSDNRAGFTADFFRTAFANLGVPPGFLRESKRYTVDPSGLGIEYEVIDREQYKMPPKPAFSAKGSYQESPPRVGDPFMHVMCTVTLRGNKETLQSDLVVLAVQLANAKIAYRGQEWTGLVNPEGIFDGAELNVNLFENEVTYTSRQRWSPNSGARLRSIPAFNRGGDQLTRTPYVDGKPPSANAPPYFSRGTAGIFLQAAAYFDPSLQQIFNANTGQTEPGLVPGQAGATLED